MFAIIKDNTFVQFLASGTPFTLDDIQYPANWLNLSTPEEKAALGIVDVVYGTQPDDRYYWVSHADPIVNDTFVKVDFVATPKDFAQVKATVLNEINRHVDSILSPSDYMSIKAIESNTPMADNWKAWRAEIRTQAQTAKAAINGAKSVDDIVSARTIVWANDPDYVATK